MVRNRVALLQRAVASAAASLALALAMAAGLAARQKRAMTFMDVMEMRSVGAPQLSPDGRSIVYTVSIPAWRVGKNFTDLFAAATDGSTPPRQFTFTKEKNETEPRWARDNRTIGFLSDRDGPNQLYLLRVDGGEARKLSDAKDGVNQFAFSRDGKWVAFSAGKATERQLWLVAMDSDAAPVALTHHATPVVRWEWSPDSSRIFFTARDHMDKDDETRREKKFDVTMHDPAESPEHLWSLEISGRAEKRWTSGDEYGVEQFTIAPDSSVLAFRSVSTDRHANTLDQLDSEIYLLSLSSGDIRRVTNNHVPETMP